MAKKQKNIEKMEVIEPVKPVELELIDFESWYGLREKLIPVHHYKEIIKADFKARKVPNMASVEDFDAALKKYGIELKLT